MQPEALNCPNCGGAVAADRPNCEFCSSRLKTVACRSCLGLMFLGSRFCGQCGGSVQEARLCDDEGSGECPRCKILLESLEIGSVGVEECASCGGFWLGTKVFNDLCANQEQQASVLGFLDSFVHTTKELLKISYLPCPVCGELMNRSNFGRASGVIIDTCKSHGVWLDSTELSDILQFIDKGGLVRQREKEKIALEEERARLREERLRIEALGRRTSGFVDE